MIVEDTTERMWQGDNVAYFKELFLYELNRTEKAIKHLGHVRRSLPEARNPLGKST